MDALATAIFLSVAANRIIEAFVAPIKLRYPDVDLWWLVYVAWVVGGALSYLSGVNLFAAQITNPLAGVILTAVVVGGGSNLIADIFKPQS